MAACGVAADRSDRGGIGLEITFGIRLSPRRFAQHVETRGKAAIVFRFHAFHGFVNVTAHDKYLPHQAHRCAHGLTHKGFACLCNQALQCARAVAQNGLTQHQTPSGTVDQHAGRLPCVIAPIGVCQLVRNQHVRRLRVWHAQERLGQRQERCALFCAKAVLLQKRVYPAIGLHGPQIVQQAARSAHDFAPHGRIDRSSDHQWC